MDIPDFEELEWLESHTAEGQFDGDFELETEPPSPPSSPPSEKPPERPTLSLPPKPSPFKPQSQINNSTKKRAGSDLPKSLLLDVEDDYDLCENFCNGKRSRIGEVEARKEKFAPSKRPVETEERSGAMDAADVDSMEKTGGGDDDEEWLRYSPPRGIVEEMEVVESEKQERILSRYASEIDGDCVPVTGLDGERVYAKICRVEMDEEKIKKRFSGRGDFNGKQL